jgi:threonine dehydrogenase-like Zn-dependent dehydrogenase
VFDCSGGITVKGKAALYHGLGKAFTIEELPVPEVEPGGILVRVTAASVCGSDLHLWRGDSQFPKERLPRIPGHEFCGYVHTLGKGVSTDSLRRPLKEGDRVAFMFNFPCMRCYHCVRGEFHVCEYRWRRNVRYTFKEYPYCDGGFAEYFYLQPGHWVFKAPDELPDEAVAPVNCAMAQVTFGLNQSGIRTGDTIVIQGAGGLGIYAAAIAHDLGAGKVISIDGQKPRLDLVKRCGATHTIDISQIGSADERVKTVKDLTEGTGADFVLEVTGVPQAIPEGLAMVRKGGTFIEIGQTLTVTTLSGLPNLRILCLQHYNPWVIPACLDFLARTKDKYDLLKMTSHKFHLEKINEAFDAAEWSGKQTGSQVTRAIVNP